ncbi:hypothetical protein [Veillonella criceti]|uniref:Uncharacterized protein n=1 Tax=Veillonella criceti TaxID=103891 RepID=A0A380NDN9_9FIRM|nr:hypothetical protein [Veillonella criceti]SUP37138.1 Uncharacterised protein [Veillonella criceti]
MKLLRNKYRWLAVLVALWTRGVSFVMGAPPATIDVTTTNFTSLPVVLTEEKDTLIFSDSPEYVNKNGVLAAGTVNGTGRVYFYHVNEMPEPQKIAIIMENTSKQIVDVVIHREVVTKPNREYFVVGSELSREELDTPYVSANHTWQAAAQTERSAVAAGLINAETNSSKSQQDTNTKQTSKDEGQGSVEGAIKRDERGVIIPAWLDDTYKNRQKETTKDKEVSKEEKVQQKARLKEADNWRKEWLQREKTQSKGKPTAIDSFALAPNGKKAVFTQLDTLPIQTDDLFSGILDFTASGPVFVKVLMLPITTPSLGGAVLADTLAMDEVALRGTYVGAQRRLTLMQPYDSSLGPAAIMVANDREDPFVAGIDELTASTMVTNRGNYGVTYELTIPTTGQHEFALYINPLGGAYAGSFKVTYDGHTEIYNVPSGARLFLGNGTTADTQYFGSYKAGKLLHIQFIPAGASNLPIQFLLVPQN